MFKLILATALSPLVAQCAPAPIPPAPAPVVAPAPYRVIVGELETGPVNVSPPTRLDVRMWEGSLGGETPKQRCADMGGIGPVREVRTNWLSCLGVDY